MFFVLRFLLVAVDNENLEFRILRVLIGLFNEFVKRLHKAMAGWTVLCCEKNSDIGCIGSYQDFIYRYLLIGLMLWNFLFMFFFHSWCLRLRDNFAFDEIVSENSLHA